MPTQAEADRWAREKTDGLIGRVPLTLDPDTLLVLASALATKVAWREPYDLVEVADTPGGAAAWPSGVATVLASAEDARKYILDAGVTGAGNVAVHEAYADGLVVVSVAADPGVSQEQVLAVAHQAGLAAAGSWPAGPRDGERSLFDLELGEHHCWTLTDEPGPVLDASGRAEQGEAYLPAWTAGTEVDLTRAPALGPVLAGLSQLLKPDPRGFAFTARQVATAAFSREGFEAAAISAIAILATGLPPALSDGVVRTAALRFGGPHAVVAVALDADAFRDGPPAPDGPWHGPPSSRPG